MSDKYTGLRAAPPPLAWSPEREARGARSEPRPPRCPARGCAVVYRSGGDRLCPEHAVGPESEIPFLRDSADAEQRRREHWQQLASQVMAGVTDEDRARAATEQERERTRSRDWKRRAKATADDSLSA